MSTMAAAYGLVFASTVVTGIGHVLLKSYGIAQNGGTSRGILDPRLLSGAVFFGSSIAMNLVALYFLDFSIVYAITALNFVFVSLFAWLALREPFDRAKLLGNGLIILGVVVYVI